jgi:hypothetical protein
LGIQSKTGKDAQENIFMKKVVSIFRGYPFFFKPIQDGTTNPRMELAFREPSKRITKNNKTSQRGDALNTVINWKNTTNNAYDGEKLHMLYLDEAGKWEKPTDIREAWRIERTCLIVGKRIVGKALVGSTVNPMNKGGEEYRGLWEDSDPNERNNNGRTRSGLYRIFIPAYEALEGFFDRYGKAIIDYPNPVVQGNFVWRKKDEEVVFSPDPNGRFRVAWLPPDHLRNNKADDRGKRIAPNAHIGVGGVDSYDLDATVDGRGSKGALHMYNKFNMDVPPNMFVVEYASRPDLASIFYEDVLMCAFFYGYPLLIENNKYGIARYFESRGYDGYLMDRPQHLRNPNSSNNVRTKGIPSNSQDVIQSHAQAIEAYIHDHVGVRAESGEMGQMLFNKTLEDWIAYKIDKRTKFDLTISSGLALLGAQKAKKKKPKSDFQEKTFFRTYKPKAWHS